MSKILSIKYTTSKHDRNGNSHSAITVTDLVTGKIGIAKTDCIDNDRAAMRKLFGEHVDEYCFEYEEVLGVRAFDRFVKGMPYAGSGSDVIITWIKDTTGFTFDAKYAPGREVLIQMTRCDNDDRHMSFYTTIQKVREGVGQHTRFNQDVREALAVCIDARIVGITFGDYNEFQLSLV